MTGQHSQTQSQQLEQEQQVGLVAQLAARRPPLAQAAAAPRQEEAAALALVAGDLQHNLEEVRWSCFQIPTFTEFVLP
jgi:hypothetical protein